jgi:hypothetical protein
MVGKGPSEEELEFVTKPSKLKQKGNERGGAPRILPKSCYRGHN